MCSMSPTAIGRRLRAGFLIFLRRPRSEIDFVLLFMVAATSATIIARIVMLRGLVGTEELGWQHLHGQHNPWVIVDYFSAIWTIIHQDLLYLTLATIFCLCVCAFVPFKSVRLATVSLCAALVTCGLIILIINVVLAPIYGAPLDFTLLKYSGLTSGISPTLLAIAPPFLLQTIAIACAVLIALPLVAGSSLYQGNRHTVRYVSCALLAGTLVALTIIPVAANIPGLDKMDARQTKNSLAYFFESFAAQPEFNLYKTFVSPTTSETSDFIIEPDAKRPTLVGQANNVLVVVLEFVGAEYFELLNKLNVLPAFSQLMSHSIYFSRAYAAAPISNVSLVAMLTSTGPLGDYRLVTSDYHHATFSTSYDRLKQNGFATGFFWSDDSSYLGIKKFLQNRSIDLNQDYAGRKCPESADLITANRAAFSFSADSCTASSLLSWIDSAKRGPFFATLWTEQTHYPYAATKHCLDIVDAKAKVADSTIVPDPQDWPRYAAAICDADGMMSKIIDGLKERGLWERTLLIVVGDHGELFGQHGHISHGSAIFEEQIRVPLLVSAGTFLTKAEDTRLASHLDIAPTIVAALGIDPSREWEGSNLLGGKTPRRAYFYNAWGSYQIGYREGDAKYIYDAVKGSLQSFDLKSDPYEQKNLGGDPHAMSIIAEWFKRRRSFASALH